MAKFRGTVKKNDLEGGFWELHADDGKRYQLRGGTSELHVEGKQVEVEGQVDRQAFSIAMAGPILDVKNWTAR